ncbi:MAG: hypothetical protein IT555_08045 [Acetobacteraceae bacterium]|nr:hypothetical protein [Acetobacteraceae bacterium]
MIARMQIAVPILIGAIFCAIQLYILAPNDDNIYLLTIAGQMLSGKRYYYDFFELNPPLYCVLLFPVQWLHAISGIDLQGSFVLWISVLIVTAITAISHMLPRLMDEHWMAHTGIVLAIEAVLFFVPGMDFGERDHLALVFLLPALVWIAGRMHRERTTAFGFAVIIVAALGVLIKPPIIAAAGAAYAVRLATERDWQLLIAPVVWCSALVAGLYGATILLWFPDWLRVAKVAHTAYAAYDTANWFDSRSIVLAVLIGALASVNEIWGTGGEKRLGRILAAASIGAVGSYLLQRKGLDYHLLPATLLTWLLVGLVAMTVMRWAATRWRPRLLRYRVVALWLLAALPLFRSFDWTLLLAKRIDVPMRALAETLHSNRIGPRIAVFATRIYPAYPLPVYRPTLPAWRFAQPWLVPWIIQQERAGRGDAPETQALTTELLRMVVEDFHRFTPDGLMVDESREQWGIGINPDMLGWFRKDPRMAKILSGYERVAEFDDPVRGTRGPRYGIYRRRSE